jgi:hypothetical protein
VWKTLSRVQHSNERLTWGSDDGQGDEEGLLTMPESPNKGELVRKDNNLDKILGFSPPSEVGIEGKCKPKGKNNQIVGAKRVQCVKTIQQDKTYQVLESLMLIILFSYHRNISLSL